MRKLIFTIFAALSLNAFAIHLAPSTRILLGNCTQVHDVISRESTEQSPYVPLMIMIDDESCIDNLTEMGVIIYNRRDDILLTSVPRDSVPCVLDLPQIISAETAGKMSLYLDKARPFAHVSEAQEMTDPQDVPYDGHGVIVGFSDIGFDKDHIAFKNRVKAMYQYDAAQGKVIKAETRNELRRWHTDNPNEWHATHVANILAGSYMGAPYFGVAKGAEIVGATSCLTDVGILAGVEDIIAYAKDKGKPAVVNLSLGNSLGPHDGSSLFCQYISRCAQDAVICLSAGNTGVSHGYAFKYIENDQDVTKFCITNKATLTGFELQGMTELWSDTSTPFDLRIEVADRDTKALVYTSPWISDASMEDGALILSLSDEDAEWNEYIRGRIMAVGDLSPLNDRYCISVAYDLKTDARCSYDDRLNRYVVGIAFKGLGPNPQSLVDIFSDSHNSVIYDMPGQNITPTFSILGTISDMCTADGVISVGSCNSRNTVPSLYDGSIDFNFEVGRVSDFSSCSNRPNMPRLPHFCAPGNYVVSAMSTQYVLESKDTNKFLAAVSLVDGDYYYWSSDCGTSMSSPYAAGTIALWLQANPYLTTDEIIEIAQSTASRDFVNISDSRWGAGCINALAGLDRVVASMDSPILESNYDYKIFTISGLDVTNAHSLSPGMYIIMEVGKGAKKIVVK